MKIFVIAFGLLILIPAAFSQPIQKYVVDGKTYYGQPPAGLSLDVNVENVRIDNTYVDEEGYKQGMERNKENEVPPQKATEVPPQKATGNRMPNVETPTDPMSYEKKIQAEDKKRREAGERHKLRMEKLRCTSPRKWNGSICK